MIATCIAVVGIELGLSALLLLLFRSVKLTIEDAGSAVATLDMILARNRAGERKVWLTEEGDKAEILE